ncbi:MAG: GlsB/YeaQ/YmgE family stress response membrane protein [Myxococcaceae bacterium]
MATLGDASLVAGGGMGIVGDIVVGVVGAFICGWVFRSLGSHAPFAGIAGTITVAFVGAVLLVALLRLVRSGRRRPV